MKYVAIKWCSLHRMNTVTILNFEEKNMGTG